MRSVSRTVKYPTAIYEKFEERARELGYPSVNAYLVGLSRYDLLTRREHCTTAEISNQPEREQDLIDDEIAQMFSTGETLKGAWFAAQMREAVKEVADGKYVPTDRVVSALLARIKDRKSRG